MTLVPATVGVAVKVPAVVELSKVIVDGENVNDPDGVTVRVDVGAYGVETVRGIGALTKGLMAFTAFADATEMERRMARND
jgi:hypothetical protein